MTAPTTPETGALPPVPVDYARHWQPVAEAPAQSLVIVTTDSLGRPIRLRPATAAAWFGLQTAARAADLDLRLLSGFRSVAHQTEIVRRKLARGLALTDILRVNAYPGFSEHHSGDALDLGTPEVMDLTERFAATPAFAWLTAHAPAHGFQLSYPRDNAAGLTYEPWHWRWHADRADQVR